MGTGCSKYIWGGGREYACGDGKGMRRMVFLTPWVSLYTDSTTRGLSSQEEAAKFLCVFQEQPRARARRTRPESIYVSLSQIL